LAYISGRARRVNGSGPSQNGKLVAELVPHRSSGRNLEGCSKDELFIIGDIISPIDVEWDAMKRSCSTPMQSFGSPAAGSRKA
jgi:hypothetical protein